MLLLKLKYREGVEHKGWKQQRLRRVLLLKLKYREGIEHKGWKQQRLRLVLLQGRAGVTWDYFFTNRSVRSLSGCNSAKKYQIFPGFFSTPISCFLFPTGLRGVVAFNIWARKSLNELVEEIEDDTLEVGVEVEVVGIGVEAAVGLGQEVRADIEVAGGGAMVRSTLGVVFKIVSLVSENGIEGPNCLLDITSGLKGIIPAFRKPAIP